MVAGEYLVRPAHDREGPQAGREPRVQHILVLLERVLGVASDLPSIRVRRVEVPSNDPELAVVDLQTMSR